MDFMVDDNARNVQTVSKAALAQTTDLVLIRLATRLPGPRIIKRVSPRFHLSSPHPPLAIVMFFPIVRLDAIPRYKDSR